jgi:predicted transcriptional regulator
MKQEILEKYVLLSIQPKFADKIFDGTKKVELRRSFPRAYDTVVILYVSTPIKAIVGGFRISHILEDDLETLWHKVKRKAGITQEQFDTYYAGVETGYGIFIESVWKYEEPHTLDTLRDSISNFSAPQNFRYLNTDQVNTLNLLNFKEL